MFYSHVQLLFNLLLNTCCFADHTYIFILEQLEESLGSAGHVSQTIADKNIKQTGQHSGLTFRVEEVLRLQDIPNRKGLL